MTEVHITSLAPKDPALAQVGALIGEMYEYMGRHGLMIPLAAGGVEKLLKSMEMSLGRTGMLVAAVDDGNVQGFCYGSLRVAPEYLDERLIGYVGHSYVRDSLRGGGIGSRMFDALAGWFKAKGVSSIELQVLTKNDLGIKFWESRGFEPELLQMRLRLNVER